MYAFAAIHGDKINAYGTGYQCLFFDVYCSCHVTFPHLIVNHYCYLVSLFLDKSLRSNITGKMYGKCLITIKYNILDLTAFETSLFEEIHLLIVVSSLLMLLASSLITLPEE